VLVVAGCGSGVRQRGEVAIVIEKRVPSLDPRVSADSAAERVRQLLFNSLTKKDAGFEATPDLAESFTAGPLSYSFTLRPGVKFHDGRPLRAADVRYTFESLLAPGFASQKKAELSTLIERIDAPDDLSVVFHCRVACPGLPNAIIPIGIIPEGSGAAQATNPVGTGAFVFVENIDEQQLTLRANPEYFEGAPPTSRLVLRIIPDASTRESELRSGAADLAINADLDPLSIEAMASDPNLKVDISDGTNIAHLGVNLLDPVLRNRSVRQAVAYAADRDEIIARLYRNQARAAKSILPPNSWAYEPMTKTYTHDPALAARLLDASGYKPDAQGRRIILQLKTSSLSIARKVGEALQEQMRQAGIELQLLPLERQKLTQDIIDGNFQLYLNTLVGGNQSPDIFRLVYASNSIPPNGQNRSRYSNPALDRLLDEASTSPRARQKEIYSEIQKMLAEDLPQIYLWYPSTVVIRRSRVSALDLDPSGDWRSLRNLRLIE
jgi:peptide/nickel transport system substrate-binding protein